MNAWERLQAALAGRDQCEVPCWPQAYLYPSRFCPGGMRSYCTDAGAFVDAQIRAFDHLGYDGVGAGPDITMEAESLGAAIEIPTDAEPYLVTHPVRQPADVEALRIPNPATMGRLALVVRATELLAERFKGHVPIFCQLRGPFVLAANLMGTQAILQAVYEAPDMVHRLVAFATRFCVRYGTALAAAGADVLEIGNAIAGLLSPPLYRQFAAAPLKDVVADLHHHGVRVAVHMCGQTAHLLDQVIASGADILQIDTPVNLPEIVVRYGRPVAWMGNVDPVQVLLPGPPARVRATSLGLLQQMGPQGRFILSAGCEPSILTPPEHLKAMIDAAREFNADAQPGAATHEETAKA